jgi:hypothetical protein
MLAFVGTAVSKQDMLAQLEVHAEADELIKGHYWEDGKGCAIGCVLESIRKIRGYKTIDHTSHGTAEDETNIPEMVWHLVDSIFEGLPNASAKEWPMRFTRSIACSADLSLVGWQFLHWLLTDKRVNPGIDHDLVRDAVQRCADVLAPIAKGGSKNGAAKSAAESAESAASAAKSTAASAERAAARSAAWAARSAAWAAWAAESAAARAAWAAESAADSAASAEGAASATSWVLMADKLVELIEAAPVPEGAYA